jgi:hypothetical protein
VSIILLRRSLPPSSSPSSSALPPRPPSLSALTTCYPSSFPLSSGHSQDVEYVHLNRADKGEVQRWTMVGPRSTVVAVVNFSRRAGGGGVAPTGVVVEEVEGYVWQLAAIGSSGWKRQGRAAKAAETMPRWCGVCLLYLEIWSQNFW